MQNKTPLKLEIVDASGHSSFCRAAVMYSTVVLQYISTCKCHVQ